MNRLGILLIAISAAGCKKTVKNEEVEGFIKHRTEELGLPGAKVSCPKGVDAKLGTKFECTVELGGKPYILVATITKVEGLKLDMDTAWKDGEAVISEKLEAALAKDLSEQFGTDVAIECGDILRFLDAERAVACDLTAGATKAKVLVTFDDKLVPTTWKLDPQLLSKKKLEAVLIEPVRAKTSPGVAVQCGTEPLMPRPADGVVRCSIAEGDKQAPLEVDVDEELNVKGWRVAG